jgi:hypothetical protein
MSIEAAARFTELNLHDSELTGIKVLTLQERIEMNVTLDNATRSKYSLVFDGVIGVRMSLDLSALAACAYMIGDNRALEQSQFIREVVGEDQRSQNESYCEFVIELTPPSGQLSVVASKFTAIRDQD